MEYIRKRGIVRKRYLAPAFPTVILYYKRCGKFFFRGNYPEIVNGKFSAIIIYYSISFS